MKCIGGELDGQSYNHVPEHFRNGDMVRIPKLRTLSSDVELVAEYLIYRVCSITISDMHRVDIRKIKYLIPHDWSEWEAIQHLFRNYRAP